MSEDARIITVKKIDEERLANERQAGAEREARADSQRNEAQANALLVTRDADAARLAAQSEAGRVQRENAAQMAAAQNEADRARRDNETRMAAVQNEADRLKNENDARTAAARTEADRAKLDNETRMAAAQNEADRLKNENDARTAAAQSEADRLKRDSDAQMAAAQTEADRLKRENDAQRASAQAELDRAAKEKVLAEAEKADLRSQLLTQFNAVLQTRDTVRGLIVNMSDVLFDTAKFSLRPLAREKLAKVAGIVSGHPGLRLAVEGYTDSVGGDEYNQRLSEQRGASVRDYLVQQGMPGSSVTTKGFGKSEPVASNDTAQGRQQNRRVELVISGEIIGTEIGTPIAAR